MQHFASLHAAHAEHAWLTIGAFDGVHLGHQQILSQLTAGAHAKGAPAVVLTFDPHPEEVLRGPRSGFYLSSRQEQAALLAAQGVDVLVTHPFTRETAATSARDFVALLKAQLGLEQLWVGHDFALGRNREGDFTALQGFGVEMDFVMQVVPALELDGAPVSSSRIRALLAEGAVEPAARLLGRPFALAGEVVAGAQRGRGIGVPTANIAVDAKLALPANGVYVTRAAMGERSWGAVTNVGLRPTFEDAPPAPVVEAHLLDYAGGEFYGETLRLEFLARLRAEQRFEGVEALLAQIQRDIAAARQHLTV
ncbi:MAG: riboflavin biosynthesis protein RibF [Anaerolineales bacterium]|nr:riboflavin biosynthesis protein RibF [Anaerolineales bacterium]